VNAGRAGSGCQRGSVRAQAPLQDQLREGAGVARGSGFDGLDLVRFRHHRKARGPKRGGLEAVIREKRRSESYFRSRNCAPKRGTAFFCRRILCGRGGDSRLMPATSGVEPDGARALHHSERAVVGSADPRCQEEQRDEASTGDGAAQIHVEDITDTPARELRNGKALRTAARGRSSSAAPPSWDGEDEQDRCGAEQTDANDKRFRNAAHGDAD